MTCRRLLLTLLASLILLTSGAQAASRRRPSLPIPPPTHRLGSKSELAVTMTDGVRLATDLYLPKGPGPWPTILIRTPYGKSGFPTYMQALNGLLVLYGYAVVAQDVRGREASEGEWAPILGEARDSKDTLDWVIRQPWCNGKVGLFGASYLAIAVLTAAGELPPEVKTLVLGIANSDPYSYVYENGMLKLDLVAGWSLTMKDRQLHVLPEETFRRFIDHWPPLEADDVTMGNRTWYDDMAMHPTRDAFWATTPTRIPQRIHVPVLMFTGWFDVFLKGQMNDFLSLGSREQSRIIVGPWPHLLGLLEDPVLDYGPKSSFGPQFYLVLNWLASHLQGAPLQPWGPVRTYDIGTRSWEETPSWPPPGTSEKTIYLRGDGDPHSCQGGGLGELPPADAPPIGYTYDPTNPVPTRGGNLLPRFGVESQAPAVQEQYAACERPDVLSFYTPPLEQPLHLAGAPVVTLYVSSTAEDTAFTAKLLDVTPDGKAYGIQDGIASLATRLGEDTSSPTPPGTVVALTLRLADLHWTLPPGHRLRLDISSSNFPRFHRHPNRYGVWATIADPIPAHQTLYLDATRPSSLTLPIAPTAP